MNKIQKAALAVIVAFGMVFAQGDLWGPDPTQFPSLQVLVPDVLDCYSTGPGGDDCFEQAAGWWFGYADDGSGNDAGSAEVKLLTGWTNFKNQDLTNREDGSTLIGNALETRLTTTTTQYANAAVAFKFYPDAGQTYWGSSNPGVENITSRNGYCLTYTLTADDPMDLELGWDEATYCYDTYYAKINPASTPTVLSFTWSQFGKDNWLNSENFGTQQGCTNETAALAATLNTATEKATSMKIRVRNDGTPVSREVSLTIYQFGWAGTCNTNVATPIIADNSVINSISYELVGKTLSILSITKPVSVQVVNLHGAVVQTKTISPNANSLNLSNLSSGVYFVRVPALGYVNKIMIK